MEIPGQPRGTNVPFKEAARLRSIGSHAMLAPAKHTTDWPSGVFDPQIWCPACHSRARLADPTHHASSIVTFFYRQIGFVPIFPKAFRLARHSNPAAWRNFIMSMSSPISCLSARHGWDGRKVDKPQGCSLFTGHEAHNDGSNGAGGGFRQLGGGFGRAHRGLSGGWRGA
jgi:hypothetical protein